MVENGKINVTEHYTGLERYNFPEPLGEMLVSHHAHEEPMSMPKLTAKGHKLKELFGTSLINVALPAVIGAKMAVEGTEKGVISSECLDPEIFLNKFKATGIPYEWEELQ